MHAVNCPCCGTRIEVDFRPVAGQVWCPTCQKLFSTSAVSEPTPLTGQVDHHTDKNGSAV
jgi:uncharacterized Zn finger protein (UPF0148 family)